MKRTLPLIALCAGFASGPLAAAGPCPWAGGEYAFKEHGIDGNFSVDGDCTQLVWDRLSDGAETTALTPSKDGWVGKLSKVQVELLENGHNLRITAYGGATRQSKAERTN